MDESQMRYELLKSQEMLKKERAYRDNCANVLDSVQRMIHERKAPYESLVKIGADIHAKAIVEHPEYIFLNIGLDFYCEFTLEEAIPFLTKKIEQLDLSIEGREMQLLRGTNR